MIITEVHGRVGVIRHNRPERMNSMGGTPVSELYAIYRKLAEVCASKGVTIVRNLIGPFITSLEMQGCSITLLKVDDEILKYWDAPVNTPGLR